MCLFLTTKYKELLKTVRKKERRVLEIASVLTTTTTTKFTPKYIVLLHVFLLQLANKKLVLKLLKGKSYSKHMELAESLHPSG